MKLKPLSDSVIVSNALNFASGPFGTCINGQTFQQEAMVSFKGWQYATFFAEGGVLCAAVAWIVVRRGPRDGIVRGAIAVTVAGLCALAWPLPGLVAAAVVGGQAHVTAHRDAHVITVDHGDGERRQLPQREACAHRERLDDVRESAAVERDPDLVEQRVRHAGRQHGHPVLARDDVPVALGVSNDVLHRYVP